MLVGIRRYLLPKSRAKRMVSLPTFLPQPYLVAIIISWHLAETFCYFFTLRVFSAEHKVIFFTPPRCFAVSLFHSFTGLPPAPYHAIFNPRMTGISLPRLTNRQLMRSETIVMSIVGPKRRVANGKWQYYTPKLCTKERARSLLPSLILGTLC